MTTPTPPPVMGSDPAVLGTPFGTPNPSCGSRTRTTDGNPLLQPDLTGQIFQQAARFLLRASAICGLPAVGRGVVAGCRVRILLADQTGVVFVVHDQALPQQRLLAEPLLGSAYPPYAKLLSHHQPLDHDELPF